MRATFYEALEIPATAESPTIRSALRAVLRRFWSVPRDPSGDTEEAIRFVALGAAILTDDNRRAEYDLSARRGASVNPWRVTDDGAPLGDSHAMGAAAQANGESGQLTVATSEPRTLPAVHALTEPLPEHTLWSSGVTYGLAALALVVGCLWTYFSVNLWLDTVPSMLAMVVGLFASVFYALQAKIVVSELSGFTLSRLAITKWRRETSVFVGNPPPQQDTAWIFRLRVMELTRSAAGYSSAQHLLLRAIARTADYAMIAMVVWFATFLMQTIMPESRHAAAIIRSPLLLPIIVVLASIPWDAFFLAKWRTTPGKFLLGVVVACGVTLPDDRADASRASLARARAWVFARDAATFGIWPIALARWQHTLRNFRVSEGSWEAAGDSVSLVRATPVFVRAAGVSLALSFLIGIAAIWADDARSFWGWLTQTATSAKTLASDTISSAIKAVPGTGEKASSVPLETNSASSAPAATSGAVVANPGVITPADASAKGSANASAATPTTVQQTPPPAAPTTKQSAVVIAPPTTAPAKKDASPNPSGEFERQTALAQERRARIERAEKRAAAARSSGSYAGLQGVCERWTEDSPGSAEAWRCLGLAKYQAGAGRDALPALRQALKLEPNDPQVEAAVFRILRP